MTGVVSGPPCSRTYCCARRPHSGRDVGVAAPRRPGTLRPANRSHPRPAEIAAALAALETDGFHLGSDVDGAVRMECEPLMGHDAPEPGRRARAGQAACYIGARAGTRALGALRITCTPDDADVYVDRFARGELRARPRSRDAGSRRRPPRRDPQAGLLHALRRNRRRGQPASAAELRIDLRESPEA